MPSRPHYLHHVQLITMYLPALPNLYMYARLLPIPALIGCPVNGYGEVADMFMLMATMQGRVPVACTCKGIGTPYAGAMHGTEGIGDSFQLALGSLQWAVRMICKLLTAYC